MSRSATYRATFCLVAFVLLLSVPPAAESPDPPGEAPPMVVFRPPSSEELAAITKPDLRMELLRLAAADQQARLVGGCGDEKADVEEAAANVDAVDQANTVRIREIVEEHGWPTVAMVGSDGARAAWLLVQHADHELEFQQRSLELMASHAESDQADRIDVAYLTDRVRVNQGRPQLYGTQFYWADEKRVPQPMEDPDNVDERRKGLGMRTLRSYSKFVNT